MSDIFDRPVGAAGTDGEGVDPGLHEILLLLDPERARPGYWARFHRTVLRKASQELSRRRAMAALTVSEMVSSWARAVVPTALMAAAAAAVMLLNVPVPEPPAAASVGVEEMLSDGLDGEPIPSILSDDNLPSQEGAVFAAEIY